VASLAYRLTLFAVAPAFFLFSQPLLAPPAPAGFKPVMLGHAVPLLVAPLLSDNSSMPLAFLVGAGYLLWLARQLYLLRRERANFRLEILLLGGVFAIAIGVSLLGLAQAALPHKLFFSLYAIAIGLAFFLVQLTLNLRPQLSIDVRETVHAAYANSTLQHVDCDSALSRLQDLMTTGHIYRETELSLPLLAQRLGLSAHQLSELLNNRLGKGFSRYLREQRIAAAKAMLCDEASASVLSIGLCVGFTSQSNFYEAFREIEGMPPGLFRRLHCQAPLDR
jgi:AraC-like DNA-binding protein